MKFVCLGYFDEEAWGKLPVKDAAAFMDKCIAYDDVLRAGGHIVGGEALQGTDSAKTVHW